MIKNKQTLPRFELVNEKPLFDNGPGKYRIGIIVMSTDYVTERDFINMRPNDDVCYYVARLANSSDNNPDTLKAMEPLLGQAASLILPKGRLDSIAYSCTAASAILGKDRVNAAIASGRADVPATSPIYAATDALNAVGAKRISVLTPYQESVNTLIADRIETNGFDIMRYVTFDFDNDMDMAHLVSKSIETAAIQADHEEAEALFISCTAIRSCEIIERLEQRLGKPVVTAVQALFWKSLRLSGFTGKVPGYGQLLRQF
jgi:maleate isomerase